MGGVRRRVLGHTGKTRHGKTRQAIARQENEDDVRWVGYDEGYWDTLARQDMTRQGMKKKTKEKEEFENEDDVG